MTKLCSVCSTENRDEAQFCRACGTAFPAIQASSGDDGAPAAGVTCDECGFQNKPGIRYCANCGVSLLGTVIVPRSRAAAATAPPAPDPYAGLSPPPISYPSFAPVPPYPPAQAYPSTDTADDRAQTHPDDDPLRVDEPVDRSGPHAQADLDGASTAAVPAKPPTNRTPIVLAAVAFLVVVGGAAAWWALGTTGNAGASAAGRSAPVLAAPTAVAPAPAARPAGIVVEPAVAAAPAPAPEATAPATTAIAPAPAALPPAAAAPLPQVGDPPDAEAESRRLAAEKLRRERAARDKLDREAKAKSALEQREREAAAARAEQDAQARRRPEEAPRPRPVAAAPVAPAVPAPAPVQARTVREICAGRGTIAESMCQSRECGSPQHANEPLCRQVREAEDRRRNYSN